MATKILPVFLAKDLMPAGSFFFLCMDMNFTFRVLLFSFSQAQDKVHGAHIYCSIGNVSSKLRDKILLPNQLYKISSRAYMNLIIDLSVGRFSYPH